MNETSVENATAGASAIEADADLRSVVKSAIDNGMSQAAIAKEVGVSGTTISQWLNGRYSGDNAAVSTKVSAWRRNRDEAAATHRPAVAEWVDMPTSNAIIAALAFAQHERSISLIYGGAGIGKTTAVRHYARTRPRVWHVTAAPSSSQLMPTLEAVAATMDLRDLPNRPSIISREIVRQMTGTNGLLVIDEAQHLAISALEELRSIHDASGIGLALVGNEQVYQKVTGKRQAVFAQLFSRVGHRLGLAASTRDDTDALLKAWDVSGHAEREWAHRLASMPGGLRGLSQVLRLAVKVAREGEREIDVGMLMAAWRRLGGES